MKKIGCWFLAITACTVLAKEYTVVSPGKNLVIKLAAREKITYTVSFDGRPILAPSTLSLTLWKDRILGASPKVDKSTRIRIREVLTPVVRQKSKTVANDCEELTLDFQGQYSVVFRVYDDGFAYRFLTRFPDSIRVENEEVRFAFTKNDSVYAAKLNDFHSSFEKQYSHIPMSGFNADEFAYLPLVVELENGVKAAITETDLMDYPGLYLKGAPGTLTGLFPACPKRTEQTRDRTVKVVEREPFIAKTAGTRAFPWRAVILSHKDGDLIESQMVYKLSPPPAPGADFSWVKPGKVAWDWWNDWNVYGVDFKAGINTRTYEYYIDFASEHGLEYIVMDEGWSDPKNLSEINPAVDMPALLEYARSRDVGIILWAVWKSLDDRMERVMSLAQEYGVKGLKVDFMDRDDQWMVNYYERVAREAARNRLLVDFHGAYKPAGLMRKYPNVITQEGLKGMEYVKWSDEATPEMAVSFPFIRMLAGPMDYTPGAMRNAQKKNFRPITGWPMSMGTRCQQLAMYVVFESPLSMLSDSPSNYRKEPECLDFIAKVPTVWDETKVLDAKIADYVIVARKNGSDWYVGAMTDWTPRELSFPLSFLDKDKNYTMEYFQDGINADRYGSDYKKNAATVKFDSRVDFQLAPGGGWAARLRPEGNK